MEVPMHVYRKWKTGILILILLTIYTSIHTQLYRTYQL